MKTFRSGLIPVILLPGLLLTAVPAAAQTHIANETDWRDRKGQAVSAHDGFVGRFDGAFYWYGSSYKGNPYGKCGLEGAPLQNGFNVYRSHDLAAWDYLGACLTFPTNGFYAQGTFHRPCVLYNQRTKQYVLWCFYFRKYPDVMLTVATASSPTGPFRLRGLRKSGEEHGWAQDLGLFQDANGSAYVVYDDGHRNLRVDLLTRDYLDSTRRSVIAIPAGPSPGAKYEGAAMAKFKGKYIVAGSGVMGWNPTETTYALADNPLGPYSTPRQMSEEWTWKSQISNFLYLPESDTLVALCDQWWMGPAGRNDLEQSRYLWLPVSVNPGTGEARMRLVREWDPFARAAR